MEPTPGGDRYSGLKHKVWKQLIKKKGETALYLNQKAEHEIQNTTFTIQAIWYIIIVRSYAIERSVWIGKNIKLWKH